MLVGSTFALFGRGEDSPRPQTAPGLYRSADGGATWTQVLNEECLDIEPGPTDFSRQYASLGLRFLRTDPGRKGIYRSLDGGQPWQKISGPWTS